MEELEKEEFKKMVKNVTDIKNNALKFFEATEHEFGVYAKTLLDLQTVVIIEKSKLDNLIKKVEELERKIISDVMYR